MRAEVEPGERKKKEISNFTRDDSASQEVLRNPGYHAHKNVSKSLVSYPVFHFESVKDSHAIVIKTDLEEMGVAVFPPRESHYLHTCTLERGCQDAFFRPIVRSCTFIYIQQQS